MMLPPRLGLHDLFYLNRNSLRASSEATGHPASLLANRKHGSYWAPTDAAFALAAQTVDVFAVNGQLIPVNWYFRDWALGAALAPDGWTLAGAAGTIARDDTAAKTGVGTYSAEVTRAGTDTRLYQAVLDATAWRGRRLSAGVRAWASVADRGYVAIYDGTTRWTSAAHTGSSALEWLTVTSGRIAAAATSIVIECWVKTGNTAVNFSGALLCDGATAAQTPHATSCDYVGVAGHTLGTAGVTLTVQHSVDNFTNVITDHSAVVFNDRPLMRFFTPATAGAWRLSLLGGSFSSTPEVQIAALGMSRALPRGVVAQYDPRNTRSKTYTARTARGAPLGRTVAQSLARLRLTLPYVTEDELDSMADVRQHLVLDESPFFLAWDPGEHAEQAAFAWPVDDAEWSAPLERLAGQLGTRSWSLDLEAVAS